MSHHAEELQQATKTTHQLNDHRLNEHDNTLTIGSEMSLVHALVARGSVILAEHQAGPQDFSTAIQTILGKIPPNNSKLTYVWEQYLFHYVSEGGVTYMVMADDAAGRRVPFAFLAELQRRFSERVAGSSSFNVSDMPAYGIQGSFGPEIKSLVEEYNSAPPQDAITRAKKEVNAVTDIMVQNIDAVLSRGERIDLLVDKTDVMANQATAFRRRTVAVRRAQWWKNQKIAMLSVVVGLVILWVIVAQFCGAGLNQCGAKNSD